MNAHLPKPKANVFTVTFCAGVGYFVIDPHGCRKSGPFGSKNKALMSRDAHQRDMDMKAKRGPRPCMCCGAIFPSEGPHNRMCSPCRTLGDDTASYSFINPRRRTG